MLTNVPPIYRKREPRVKSTKSATPAAPPTLVAATLDADGAVLTLVFDQPIDIDGYVGANVYVDVATNHAQYQADDEVQRIDARSFRAAMDYVDHSDVAQTQLTALAPTGVVAVDGGLEWMGVTGLALPFAGQ